MLLSIISGQYTLYIYTGDNYGDIMYYCGNSFYRYMNNPFMGGCFCNKNDNFFGNMMMFGMLSNMMNNLFAQPQMRMSQYTMPQPIMTMPQAYPMQSIFAQSYRMPAMPSLFNFNQPAYNNIFSSFSLNNEGKGGFAKSNYLSASGYNGMSNEKLQKIYGNYTKDATVLYRGTAEDLNKYLRGKGVLEGQGQAFINAQNKYGISASVLAAICVNESGHGKSNLAKNKNNIGGVRISGSTEFRTFSSVAECIDYMGSFLKKGYLDKGLTKLYQINARYCPASDPTDKTGGNSSWAKAVNTFANQIETQLA